MQPNTTIEENHKDDQFENSLLISIKEKTAESTNITFNFDLNESKKEYFKKK